MPTCTHNCFFYEFYKTPDTSMQRGLDLALSSFWQKIKLRYGASQNTLVEYYVAHYIKITANQSSTKMPVLDLMNGF